MASKAKGKARPGSTVTRKVSRGPNKGDTVQFKANTAGAQKPGKLVPRRVTKDAGPKRVGSSIPIGKKKKVKQNKN